MKLQPTNLNTNNLHTVTWFQTFLLNTNNFHNDLMGGPHSVMANRQDCKRVQTPDTITFIFGLILLGKYEHPYLPN